MFNRVTLSSLRAIGAALLLFGVMHPAMLAPAAADDGTPESLPDWRHIIATNQEHLAHVESDQAARDVFVTTVGRASGLQDVVGTLAVQGLSPKLSRELLVPEITASAQRLVAALAASLVADRMMESLEGTTPGKDSVVSSSQLSWLAANGAFPSLDQASRLWESGNRTAAMGVAAGHLAQEASRRTLEEWWRLKSWKDRVRTSRGQSRLCGTWQWVIHNHQRHHEEQKLSLVFPPPGKDGSLLPGLTEIVVLGDVVYLRWERDGKVQEDSLLFSKEGQRLEGTFINSHGGWGSVSGKRTASCTP